ncbi:hypothetical protein BDA99DRAFT_527340 [Phascolomyces articulosus]|uniref:Uncharacterized protein n=1 Tax=Phascolomyces articulosus TaxID=60185 RepID=A0AAD5P7Y8_9FUNG|nr:hypothetical protein BDA99DRAFT_527340 [Phascolomyces articulosus]
MEKRPRDLRLCDFDKNEFDDVNDTIYNVKNIAKNNTHPKDNCTIEKKISSSSSNNDISSLSPTTTTACKKGLARFVIFYSKFDDSLEHPNYQQSRRFTWERCYSILNNKRNQGSLELLYLEWDRVAIQSLLSWYDNNYPIGSNLRELHLDDRYYDMDTQEKAIGSIDKKNNILRMLFPCLPALEALFINQSKPGVSFDTLGNFQSYLYQPGQLFVDDDALRMLAKHCYRIRYIDIIGYPSYTSEGILSLAQQAIHPPSVSQEQPSLESSTKKLSISYLRMDIPHDIILQLVKELHSLKTFVLLRSDVKAMSGINNYNSMSPKEKRDMFQAGTILRERGGSFTLDTFRD